MKTLLQILLVLLLLLGARKSVCAQSKDSLVIKGCFIANDSTDLALLSKNWLSVSEKKFHVVYRNKFAHTESPFHISEEFFTNTEGCFEVKLPKSIYISNVFFHFPNKEFKDCYAILREEENIPEHHFYLKSTIKIAKGPIIICPRGGGEINTNFGSYNADMIEKRGLDNILKDIH